ncbi:MAG: EamA family transporter [Synergistaceae bacterium]|nr:EamA family transporter [Synergistaceae bacterium]
MSFEKLLPVIMIVAANIFYDISTKAVPGNINKFCALIITYLTAAIISAILFLYEIRLDDALTEFSKINWAPFVLAAAIIILELGYILLYRAGWKISEGALVANTLLALCLIIIGYIFYHEHISLKQICGVILCVAGLILICK